MELLGRLVLAATVAAGLSVVATILYLVITDPCDCERPGDMCVLFYFAAPVKLIPIGLLLFLPVWAVVLNVSRLSLTSRVAYALAVSVVILGGFAGVAFYYEHVWEPPPHLQSAAC